MIYDGTRVVGSATIASTVLCVTSSGSGSAGIDGTTWWEQDADESVLAASLMKVPVAMAAMALDLDAAVVVHPEFDSVVAGTRFELDEDGDQDPDTWAEVGAEPDTARAAPPLDRALRQPRDQPGDGADRSGCGDRR